MTKKILSLSLFLGFLLLISPRADAKSGCCSWHGGVSHCDTSVGRQVCNDGTYSPSCGCSYIPPAQPKYIPIVPKEDDLIKGEVDKAKIEYYKNNQWFRERLILKIANSLGTDTKKVSFYVYTILKDIK